MKTFSRRSFATIGASLVFTTSAFGAGPSGRGSDIWTSYMEKQNLFVPHGDNGTNYCDATETFVSFTPDSKGYCIELNERAALSWEEARQNCLWDGKRLPEPAEWVYACNRAGALSLTNMVDDYEWISNYSSIMEGYGNSWIASPIGGNAGCGYLSYGGVGTTNTHVESWTYRCVR